MKVPWQKERSTGGETAVQLRSGGRSTFGRLESYVPLLDGETALYREVREAVPVVDAAICKLIRLTGGVRVACGNERAEQGLQRFLCEVPVGRGQRGINAFLDCYLDSLLTCGRAVGEIVPDAEGREIAAVLCADVSQVEVREGDNPLEFCLCGVDGGGRSVPLEYQDLLLFTPLNPEAGHPYGVSMLRSMPYLTGLLLKIYDAMGKNWDRCGNVRFAVTYKPQDGELDRGAAQERAEQIAEEWSRAMQEGRNGSVRDFVSVRCIDQGHRLGQPDPRQRDAGTADLRAAGGEDGAAAVYAGAELVVDRADELAAGGYADKRDHGAAAHARTGHRARLYAVA